MKLTDILARLDGVEADHDGHTAFCKAHNDRRHPSLKLTLKDDGKLLVVCRSGCSTADILKSLGLAASDLFDVDGQGTKTVSSAAPETVGIAEIAGLRHFVDLTSGWLNDVDEAVSYLSDRFGLAWETAQDLGVGFYDRHIEFTAPWLSKSFTRHPRLTVPFAGFDGVIRGLQGRDLSGRCPARWVGLANVAGKTWAKYGVLRSGAGFDTVLVCEGPGDALTAVGAGYDSIAIRGAGLARNAALVAELAEGLGSADVVLCGDRDRAGAGFTDSLAGALVRAGVMVRRLEIPHDGDDVTDWRARDPEGFPAALHAAVRAAEVVVLDAPAPAVAPPVADPDVFTTDAALETMEGSARQMFDGTDVGIAVMLRDYMRRQGGGVRHARGLGFLVWDGTVWAPGNDKVREALHLLGAELIASGDDSRRRLALKALTNRSIKAVIDELPSVPGVAVRADELDVSPELLSVANGTVNLRTGVLHPHTPDDMITKRLDVAFRPDAPAERWNKFLTEVFPNHPEMPAFMRRLVGYGATGSTAEHCFAFMHGQGSNGKALTLSTPIVTPSGPSTMGDIQVGMEVYGPDGLPTKVVGVSQIMHGHDVYTVTTRSGRVIDADADHLWTVYENGTERTMTTSQMLGRGLVRRERPIGTSGRTGKEYRFGLPRQRALVTADIALPVDPYTLGYWLGNGTARSGQLTVGLPEQEEVLRRVRAARYTVTTQASPLSFGVLGLAAELRNLGLYRNKHVPEVYLMSGTSQRLEILRGLLDSDGFISAGQGQVEFCNTNKRIAEGALYLVRSLGWTASMSEHRAMLYGKDCGPKYRVMFTPRVGDPSPFHLKRKTERIKSTAPVYRDSIVSIEAIPSEPVKCIKVAAEDSLYLAGWGLVPTHNTVFLDALTHVLKGVTQATQFSTFEKSVNVGQASPELASLRGARIVTASETEKYSRLAEALVKQLTGSDPVTCRFLNQNPFTYIPSFLLMVAGNFKPAIMSQDEGTWRRVKLIPFDATFSHALGNKDTGLPAKLREEAEGILAWIVAGAVEWHAHGLREPASVVTATQDYRESEDRLQEWIEACLVQEDGAVETPMPIRRAYAEWCEDAGMTRKEQLSGWSLGIELESRGFPKRRVKGRWVFVGVRLKTDVEKSAARSTAEGPNALTDIPTNIFGQTKEVAA